MNNSNSQHIENEFFERYSRLIDYAQSYGIKNVPVRKGTDQPFLSARHQKKFISACHRGYERAQDEIVSWINELQVEGVNEQKKDEKELLLRKVADAIAHAMLQLKTHVARRLVLHDFIPPVPYDILTEAKSEADKLNKESRQTFALLSDICTFIHVSDLVRVDHRPSAPTLSLIELKSGKVNELLLSKLDSYSPSIESLEDIDKDDQIETKHKDQAKRMMRQRIRAHRVTEILTTDSGIDIKSELPIFLSENELFADSYDQVLVDLIENARNHGIAAGMVNYTIHLGVGYSEDPNEAQRISRFALQKGIDKHRQNPPNKYQTVMEEVEQHVDYSDQFKLTDLYSANLYSLPCFPLVMWGIPRVDLFDIISKKICVMMAFDLVSFIWLGRKVGLDFSLSTRKEASRQAQSIGGREIPTWSNRALKCSLGDRELFMASGFLSRFFTDLQVPYQFLEWLANENI